MAPGFQLTQQIRFGDIDAYNHVNNVAYLQYLEDARVQLFYAELPGGSTFRGLLGPELFTLVGRHEIEYLAPISFRTDPIHVNTWVTHVGGSSFELGYTVTEADTSIIYAQAATSMVVVSRDTGRPVRLTETQKSALNPWRGDPVPFRRAPARPVLSPAQGAH
ncbi:acyl-CoA thioesterase [Arthrobacter psychrochitiniphilus]|uniref:Acyl-CoA thioesterase n=1 Tax=Arthrobacter psychrochitiniphilus TaxID=291045 RepID=A0A2V3DX40_9MICC|nr:thioesterase family protein [Arthrobacter psychrochitiniphilus]NYG17822.1 acyl-CoA thioester hydrolase [Arthrobacter psychrochitiniphilus]PXA65138.1 acyl-CoA thioesterase [Arthrobacter psychrochitiniphilus]